MRTKAEIMGNPRVKVTPNMLGFDAIELRTHGGVVLVLFGADEDGWEHASVSPKGSKYERDQPCPTWAQMCAVKSALWYPHESVMQFHPSEEHYLHGICGDTNILHLWRPKDGDWSRLNDGMTA